MKYIMFQKESGQKIPIIFPKQFVHSQIAESLEKLIEGKIVSAGEINFVVQNCFGNSSTLKVGVIKGDAKLIDEHDYMFGFSNELGLSIKELKELFNKENKDDSK